MNITERAVTDVLAATRVVEFSTLTRDGGVRTWPMSAAWLPARQQIVLTTPVAYAAKVRNVRRDGRIALLYSDFTGSRLTAPETVLVQGIATVPDGVAAPQDVPEFWREMIAKNPTLPVSTADEEHRRTMDWYYWRLPMFVTPWRVHRLTNAEAGGELPTRSESATTDEQIDEALRHYPTAAFTARDEEGHPYSVRAEVARDDTGEGLSVRPSGTMPCPPGPASLLWHRHDGRSGNMASTLVTGSAAGTGQRWTLRPLHLPARLDTTNPEEWLVDARARSLSYLDRHGLSAPAIDWQVLTG